MGTPIIYRPLLRVDLWHAFYLHSSDVATNEIPVYSGDTTKQDQVKAIAAKPGDYSILRELSFTPTESSIQLMKGGKMRFRQHNSGFSIWIQAEQAGTDANGKVIYQPFVPLDANFKVVVAMRLRDSSFVNFTNVGMDKERHFMYYFSNKANNAHYEEIGGEKKLLFLFLNDKNSPAHYISDEDRVPVYSHVRAINVDSLGLKQIRFSICSLGSPFPTLSASFRVDDPLDYLETCKISLLGQPTGLFELKAYRQVQGSEEEISGLREVFFHHNGGLPADTFGVIELFHLTDGTLQEYSMLEGQQLRAPTYTLWWQNRMTKWRYIFNGDQPAPFNEASDVEYENSNPKKLITKVEHPFIQKYRKIRYRTGGPGNEEEFTLPNPTPERLYPDTADNCIYSEVHMGNINFHKI